MKNAQRKGAFPLKLDLTSLLIKLANEKALRYYVFINIGNQSAKSIIQNSTGKAPFCGGPICHLTHFAPSHWINFYREILLDEIYVRQEGRPCVSLISRQFSSGRPVLIKGK